jgi:hypothetical protein
MAKRPSCERETGRACSYDLPDEHSEIFFASRLDTPNQFEMVQEIDIGAQVDLAENRWGTLRFAHPTQI